MRCHGERLVTFALFDGDIEPGERVLVSDGGRTRPAIVVIGSQQLLEFHAPEPTATAEADDSELHRPDGDGAELLRSLDLPDDQ